VTRFINTRETDPNAIKEFQTN